MTAILKLFPSWAWLVLGGVLLTTVFAFGWRQGGASARVELAQVRQQAAQAKANAEKAQREIERQRAQAVQEVQDHAQSQIDALAADLAASRAAGDGLRAAAASTARRACPRTAVASSGKGEPDTDALDLLVGVLGRLEEGGREMAEHADRLRIAGAACEASYNALTAPAGVRLFPPLTPSASTP